MKEEDAYLISKTAIRCFSWIIAGCVHFKSTNYSVTSSRRHGNGGNAETGTSREKKEPTAQL